MKTTMTIGRFIIFFACLLTVSACTTTAVGEMGAASREATFTNTVWQLRQVGGQAVDTDGGATVPHVIFLDDNRVSGFGGCNRFGGRYGTVSGQFRFLEMSATRESCARISVENRFLAAMKSTRGLELTEGRLLLMDSAGVTVARFQPIMK